MRIYAGFLFLVWFNIFSLMAAGPENTEKIIRIYIDADFSNTGTAARGIEKGIRTAFDEENNQILGYKIEVVPLDYGGNSARSHENLLRFMNDDKAIAVFAGLHSSPIMAQLKFINDNNILMLVPWAAAGPVTRYPSENNCVFRLSCDDSRTGEIMVQYILHNKQMKSPALLLEQSVWGHSNEETILRALESQKIKPVIVNWFNWGISQSAARILLRNTLAANPDVILMVANVSEGQTFCQAMASLPPEQRCPMVSHWGITGGNFPKMINAEEREKLDLVFIQSTFSFFNPSPMGEKVFANAMKLFPEELRSVKDLPVPGGFVNAYDLTRILIAAIHQAGLSGNVIDDRRRIRSALENLEQPIPGLIKTYIRPFQKFDGKNPNAHEALQLEDFTMGKFAPDNTIRLISLPLAKPANPGN